MRSAAVNGAVRLAGWSVFLVVTLRLLHGPAFGELAVPLGSIDALGTWADRTSPAVMALALVRLAALAATWYLVAVTILAVAADVIGWRPLRRLAGAVSPPLVRHIATRTAGAGLAAGALLAGTPLPPPLSAALSSAPGSAADRPATTVETATMGRLPPVPDRPPTWTATMTREPAPPPAPRLASRLADPAHAATQLVAAPIAASPAAHETATMTRTDHGSADGATEPAAPRPVVSGAGAGGPSETATMTRRSAAPAEAPPAHVADADPPATDAGTPTDADPPATDPPADGASATDAQESWVVELGDSFWSITEDVVGATVGDAVVDRYWRRLVAANRDGLLDPGNPDLLVPGQRLVLPPPG